MLRTAMILTGTFLTVVGNPPEYLNAEVKVGASAIVNVLRAEEVAQVDVLANYSTAEIEYARIWLQFGPNPEVEELYVEYISAGTLINPVDERGSLPYPEAVVQLSGSRLIDGAVTYSSNGNGTINIYNVPKRWEDPSTYNYDSDIMFEVTWDIIANVETIYVDPNQPEQVADMADRIIFLR